MMSLEDALAAVVADPQSVVDRLPGEPVNRWCARAVQAALSTVIGPDPEGYYNGTPANRALMQNAILLAQRERVLDVVRDTRDVDLDELPQRIRAVYGEVPPRQLDAAEVALLEEQLANARVAARTNWDATTHHLNEARNLRKLLEQAMDALQAAQPVLAYVSQGRHYPLSGEPYPDAQARRANAMAADVVAAVGLHDAEEVAQRVRRRTQPRNGAGE